MSRILVVAAPWSSSSAVDLRVTIVHFVLFAVFAFTVQAATQAREEEGEILQPGSDPSPGIATERFNATK